MIACMSVNCTNLSLLKSLLNESIFCKNCSRFSTQVIGPPILFCAGKNVQCLLNIALHASSVPKLL